MKEYLLVLLLLTNSVVVSQPSNLTNKTWSYKSISIIYKQDTLPMYRSDSARNMWYVGKVSISFKSDNNYAGTNIKGDAQVGIWSMPNNQTIIVDRDTSQIVSITSKSLTTVSDIKYLNADTIVEGKLLIVFFITPSVTSFCESARSGDWTSAATWTCGHEPTIYDVAVINPGHTITVSTNSARVQRIIYLGGSVKFLTFGSKIFVKGND